MMRSLDAQHLSTVRQVKDAILRSAFIFFVGHCIEAPNLHSYDRGKRCDDLSFASRLAHTAGLRPRNGV